MGTFIAIAVRNLIQARRRTLVLAFASRSSRRCS
jgi:hypothetical protein